MARGWQGKRHREANGGFTYERLQLLHPSHSASGEEVQMKCVWRLPVNEWVSKSMRESRNHSRKSLKKQSSGFYHLCVVTHVCKPWVAATGTDLPTSDFFNLPGHWYLTAFSRKGCLMRGENGLLGPLQCPHSSLTSSSLTPSLQFGLWIFINDLCVEGLVLGSEPLRRRT